MARSATMSPLGLYNWDPTIFDLMQIPEALNKETLVQNLLAETAELEVLYPNPVVFKNLVGVWSAKQIDIWNRLYATTQYEYNPIENYDRMETGSNTGSGSTTHSGTDTSTDTETHGGTTGRTEALTTGGKDTLDMTRREGGTEGRAGSSTIEDGGTEGRTGSSTTTDGGTEGRTGSSTTEDGGTETQASTSQVTNGGSDVVTGADTKGHWIAGFDATATPPDDGLVKQSRDQDDATTTTQYGKTENGTGSATTTFGKTVDTDTSETITFGKTVDTDTRETITFGKTVDTDTSETITFGKTETNKDETTYGKTENVNETITHGQTITRAGSMTHGEKITSENGDEHELHAHGNIGVTTTQEMIRQQREIELFNIYDIIIEDFKMRFCILVY